MIRINHTYESNISSIKILYTNPKTSFIRIQIDVTVTINLHLVLRHRVLNDNYDFRANYELNMEY